MVIPESTTFKSTAPGFGDGTMSRQFFIICSVDTGVFVNTAAGLRSPDRREQQHGLTTAGRQSNVEHSSVCE